ncbi:phage AbiD protein [Legionella spiritensis]|uniref:Phage AbiD protein n=2 Tax=Legionella spiritensis TaxID=452 RepID=A0A0W0YVS6_LEGSP|nr:phage AbiD protein [Legionella spiritensis]SNV32209.1 phage AbiD protein [Legionella spiritensis]
MRTTAGYFFMDKSKYNKPALSSDEIFNLIESKNIQIHDRSLATLYLKTVSYHRLSAYLDCLINNHNENSPPSFEDACQIYQFDRKLRLLINDALERIEIAFRTSLSDTMSCLHSPHWYLDASLFKNKEKHQFFITQVDAACRTSHEPQIKEYYKRYDEPPYPPSWLVFENLSFGVCINVFGNIKKLGEKKLICHLFQEHPTTMESWLSSLRYMRNLCAHHSRVWNRWFVICPALSFLFNKKFDKERTCYAQLIVLDRLLKIIAPENDWKSHLKKLMKSFKRLPYQEMGFSIDWESDTFWHK